MVNYLHCEYPLPFSSGQFNQIKDFEIDWPDMEFQTKSLLKIGDPFDRFTISEDGQIYKQSIDGEFCYDNENECDIGNFMTPEYGQLERVDDFSGEIRFYGMHMTDSFDIWMEFVIFYKNGELIDIFVTEWKKEDSAERILAQKKISEVFSSFNEKRTSPWYKFVSVYRGIVEFIFNLILKFIFFIKKLIT